MTDELENVIPPLVPAGMTAEEKQSIISTRIIEMSDLMNKIPVEAESARDLGFLFAVHVDEHGNLDVPQGPFQMQAFKAVLDLEMRIVVIEKALRKGGLL